MILPQRFYKKDTVTLAKALLGTCLVHESPQGRTIGRIVETEAYLCHEPASHAFRGKTPRNAVMFGPPGHAYIYFIYGMYYCFNVVSRPAGIGEAVLVRALEPLEGLELMERRRGTRDIRNLCSGPGKLMLAMGIGPELNGTPLFEGPLTLWKANSFPGHDKKIEVITTPRIGLTKAASLPLRFYLKGSRFASRRCVYAGPVESRHS